MIPPCRLFIKCLDEIRKKEDNFFEIHAKTEQEASSHCSAKVCQHENRLSLDQNHHFQEEKSSILCKIKTYRYYLLYEEFLDICALARVTKFAAIVSTSCRAIVLRASQAVFSRSSKCTIDICQL